MIGKSQYKPYPKDVLFKQKWDGMNHLRTEVAIMKFVLWKKTHANITSLGMFSPKVSFYLLFVFVQPFQIEST